MLNKTRLSLFYLIGYLSLTGLALMIAPAWTLKTLFASREYDDAMPRFAGILMLALGLVVSQIVRLRVAQLYPLTVLIRLVIWFYVLWLYFHTGETFFAAVLGVLGLGILFTGITYLKESGQTAPGAPGGNL